MTTPCPTRRPSDLREAVPCRPEHQPGQPLLEAEANGGGQRAIDDRDPARRTAEQDWAPERTMDRCLEPFEMLATAAHAMSAPPPRSEEHTSELQSLMRISYAVFCFKKTTTH